MREVFAIVVGFIVASIVPMAGLSVVTLVEGVYSVGEIAPWFLVLYPFSAAATVLLGLPAFLLLRPFRPGHWWSVSIAGLLLGILVAIILRLPHRPNPHDFPLYGALGALATLAFWGIWRRAAPAPRTRTR